jgi:hypothetical protein
MKHGYSNPYVLDAFIGKTYQCRQKFKLKE